MDVAFVALCAACAACIACVAAFEWFYRVAVNAIRLARLMVPDAVLYIHTDFATDEPPVFTVTLCNAGLAPARIRKMGVARRIGRSPPFCDVTRSTLAPAFLQYFKTPLHDAVGCVMDEEYVADALGGTCKVYVVPPQGRIEIMRINPAFLERMPNKMHEAFVHNCELVVELFDVVDDVRVVRLPLDGDVPCDWVTIT
jgi:hypothetical protein